VFAGLGILVTIVRLSLERVTRGPLSFTLDLVLWFPLQICLLVFAACWTLFYRELEARRHAQLSYAHSAHPDIPARAS
jgi:hypothetical protein